jgi:cell division protein ZipA
VLIKVASASPATESAPESTQAQIAEKLSTTSPIAVQRDLPPPIPKVTATRDRRPTTPPAPSPEQSDRISTTAPQSANTSERQRIVAIRVCAPGEMRWSGQALLSALEANGLAYGRYQVFHRKHVDGRSLFCVANIKEPGNFDVSQMPAQEFKGISLFAVLPGPLEPVLTVDELLGAARDLAGALTGMVQDARGLPLSPQRAVALREDVARFQASLAPAPGP